MQEKLRRSFEETLKFALSSGAWVVPGGLEEAEDYAGPPSDLPILAGPGGGKLAVIREQMGDCKRCGLSAGRTHIVFGVGSQNAKILFVGEGPGEEEDRRGEPFVGRAGGLLNKMISAIGYKREEVYIANVVKCRPPRNRDPKLEEIAACINFLKEQIEAINPAVICALGRHAATSLLGIDAPLGRLRGQRHFFEDVPLVATYHPAYLLRNPSGKREAWIDLQLVRDLAAG
ncbi:MAG: DNA polymerase [Deltaproteobacteria bacterium]|nr:MAG: DNA polymerase [Deltaproteobacteria bacterium]